MPYDITVSDDGDYAVIRWSGVISPEDINAAGVEGIELIADQGLERILVDVTDTTNRLSTTDLFLSTSEQSKLGPPRPKCAILGRSDQHRELSFVETVACNRGMRVKAFVDREGALTWLRK